MNQRFIVNTHCEPLEFNECYHVKNGNENQSIDDRLVFLPLTKHIQVENFEESQSTIHIKVPRN